MQGKEIVQLYIHDVKSKLVRPQKELKGFAKVSLEVGESKVVHIDIDRYSVGYWDDSYREGKGMWVAEEGEFEVWVGGSAADIRLVLFLFSQLRSFFGGGGCGIQN